MAGISHTGADEGMALEEDLLIASFVIQTRRGEILKNISMRWVPYFPGYLQSTCHAVIVAYLKGNTILSSSG